MVFKIFCVLMVWRNVTVAQHWKDQIGTNYSVDPTNVPFLVDVHLSLNSRWFTIIPSFLNSGRNK